MRFPDMGVALARVEPARCCSSRPWAERLSSFRLLSASINTIEESDMASHPRNGDDALITAERDFKRRGNDRPCDPMVSQRGRRRGNATT
jgi:hypothetical protein